MTSDNQNTPRNYNKVPLKPPASSFQEQYQNTYLNNKCYAPQTPATVLPQYHAGVYHATQYTPDMINQHRRVPVVETVSEPVLRPQPKKASLEAKVSKAAAKNTPAPASPANEKPSEPKRAQSSSTIRKTKKVGKEKITLTIDNGLCVVAMLISNGLVLSLFSTRVSDGICSDVVFLHSETNTTQQRVPDLPTTAHEFVQRFLTSKSNRNEMFNLLVITNNIQSTLESVIQWTDARSNMPAEVNHFVIVNMFTYIADIYYIRRQNYIVNHPSNNKIARSHTEGFLIISLSGTTLTVMPAQRHLAANMSALQFKVTLAANGTISSEDIRSIDFSLSDFKMPLAKLLDFLPRIFVETAILYSVATRVAAIIKRELSFIGQPFNIEILQEQVADATKIKDDISYYMKQYVPFRSDVTYSIAASGTKREFDYVKYRFV